MRIRFFRPTDEAETGRYLALGRRIDAFWAELALELRPDTRIRGDKLREAAARVDERLLVEVVDGGPLVVSTTEDGGGALADAVVARVPTPFGLDVVRYRPALDPSLVFDEVRGHFGMNLEHARARCGVARGYLAEVVVFVEGVSDAEDPRAQDAANLAVLSLLGEETFDTWVGSVDVAPRPRRGSLRVVTAAPEPEGIHLGELPAAIDRLVENVGKQVGNVPCHVYCERAEWTMLELESEPAADYAAQDDLVYVVTMLPEMTKSFLSGARFASHRFSTVGERFAYLKIDARQRSPDERRGLRLRLEDELNYALVPGRVGCVVAAGIGRRYVYVTLALSDLEHGAELALRVARSVYPGERGWLLFCDTDWSGEWIGLRDVTGPPPQG